MRMKVQRIIQLYGNEEREEEGIRQIARLVGVKDIRVFFQVIIDMAQELSRKACQQYVQNHHINSPLPHPTPKPKQLYFIGRIINHEIITIINSSNQTKPDEQQYSILLTDVQRVYDRIFKSDELGSYEFCQYLLPSVGIFLASCGLRQRENVLEGWRQVMERNENIELVIYKALFECTTDLSTLAVYSVKLIESFLSTRFPFSLQNLVNHLPCIDSQQQGIAIVTQRVAMWTMYIQLITKLIQHTCSDNGYFEQTLVSLNEYHFANVLNQIMRIDQTLQVKCKGQVVENKEVELEFVVVCRYKEFNSTLNLLKKNAVKVVIVILTNIIQQNSHQLQILSPDLINTFNIAFYSHLISDLSILSRHFLYLKQTNYLNYGQYSLIKKLYQLLNISLQLPILRYRLLSAIKQQQDYFLGWSCFLFFVCIINMGQFQYRRSEYNNNNSNSDGGGGGDQRQSGVIENRKHEVFVTNLLQSVLVHGGNQHQWRDKVITMAAQIASYLIQQSNQTLRKTLRDFGIQSDPMVQQYIQNTQHLGVWLHIIGLVAFESRQLTNISLLKLLEKSVEQLGVLKIDMLRVFLNLYLNLSKNSCAVVVEVVGKIVTFLVNCSVPDDKRTIIFLTFITKLISRNQSFLHIVSVHIRGLFSYCFRSIHSLFIINSQSHDQNNHHNDRMLKIYIDFITKFMSSAACVIQLQKRMVVLQQNISILTDLINLATTHYSKLSPHCRQSILQLTKSILTDLISIRQVECVSKVMEKLQESMIYSIVKFMNTCLQFNLQYFTCLRMLIMHFTHHIDSTIVNRALSLLSHMHYHQISSSLLISIIQILILNVIYEQVILFDYQLWENASVFILNECKNKEKQQISIVRKQDKLSSNQRKVTVKNRLRLQIQAFKLTTFLLSNYYKKHSNNNIINDQTPNRVFLSTLHNEISLTRQLSSFQQFLTFLDISMICYGIENYLYFMNFGQRRGFLVTMGMLISQEKIMRNNLKSMNRENDECIIIPPNSFNPIITIRSKMFDLLSEIQCLIKDQTNQQQQQQRRQQHQRYQIVIHLLIKELQSITIVQNSKRKILKVREQNNNEQIPTQQQHDQQQFTI